MERFYLFMVGKYFFLLLVNSMLVCLTILLALPNDIYMCIYKIDWAILDFSRLMASLL